MEEFYADMAMLGDINWDEYRHYGPDVDTSTPSRKKPLLSDKKIGNLSVPLLVLQSLDDPISTWRCNAANDGLFHPSRLVHEIKEKGGNLVILLTKKGGHVGWPLGWWPSNHNWQFMSNVASGFVNSVIRAREDVSLEDVAQSKEKLDVPRNDTAYIPALVQHISDKNKSKETQQELYGLAPTEVTCNSMPLFVDNGSDIHGK